MKQPSDMTLMIRGMIASLPEEERDGVNECYRKLLEMESEKGALAVLAIGLRGSEKADEQP